MADPPAGGGGGGRGWVGGRRDPSPIHPSLVLVHSSYNFIFSGGSLAKVAYMSEVRNIRKRHYSSSSSKSDDEDQEKAVYTWKFH